MSWLSKSQYASIPKLEDILEAGGRRDLLNEVRAEIMPPGRGYRKWLSTENAWDYFSLLQGAVGQMRLQAHRKRLGHENPAGLRAQVRRLPSGQIQLKIPLQGHDPAHVAQAVRKALGRRVQSAVIVKQ